MAGTATLTVVHYIRHLATSAVVQRLSDAELLGRFASAADGDAFAELLRRHGGLVWGVCRQLLPTAQDAEDAFQAAFLLLARRASALRQPQAVAGWLQGAACRCASELRRRDARRRTREQKVAAERRTTVVESEVACRDLLAALHEEAGRLPVGQRDAFALCALGGLTLREAAARLGRPEGTLARWLAQARERLRGRMARRGIALPAVLGLVALARPGRAAARPVLVGETIRAAVAVTRMGAAGGGTISAKVLALTREVNRTMCLIKCKMWAACLLTVSLVGLGAGLGASTLAGQDETGGAQASSQRRVGEGSPAPGAGDVPRAEDKKDYQRRLRELEAENQRLRGELEALRKDPKAITPPTPAKIEVENLALYHLPPSEAAKVLGESYSGSGARIVAIPSMDCFVVQGTPEGIKKIKAMVERLEVHPHLHSEVIRRKLAPAPPKKP
jgi:RNA polymerase sigma factor (sigma-70 family)